MKITLRQLRRIGACKGQVALFKKTFGEEVELTRENAVAYGALFDVNWLAEVIFDATKLADYRAKCAPLWADYLAKRASLLADYRAKRAIVFVETALDE